MYLIACRGNQDLTLCSVNMQLLHERHQVFSFQLAPLNPFNRKSEQTSSGRVIRKLPMRVADTNYFFFFFSGQSISLSTREKRHNIYPKWKQCFGSLNCHKVETIPFPSPDQNKYLMEDSSETCHVIV